MIIEEQALRSKTDTENKTPSIGVTKTLIAKTNQNHVKEEVLVEETPMCLIMGETDFRNMCFIDLCYMSPYQTIRLVYENSKEFYLKMDTRQRIRCPRRWFVEEVSAMRKSFCAIVYLLKQQTPDSTEKQLYEYFYI